MEKKHLYQTQWKDYLFRERLFWSCAVLLAPVVLSGLFLSHLVGDSTSLQQVIYGVYLALFSFLAMSCFLLAFWKCPQCKKKFLIRGGLSGGNELFATKCVHCDLPKFEGSSYKEKAIFIGQKL